ncbi:MAG: PD-(D/E)XK nuclease family protein, partial [Eubacteriales bacterium]
MIKFITGRSGSGKSCMIADTVAELIEKTDKNAVVIVPEQETVVWESRIASRLPASANLRLEVTNFTRLANSVFREYGGLADTVIDDGSRILIMWRAMLSVWDGMKVYNNISSREDRSIPILMSAVDELKESGITPEAAEEALNKLLEAELLDDEQNDEKNVQNDNEPKGGKGKNSAGLSDRLHDAVLVYAAYNALLHEDYIDREDLAIKLAESIAKNPFFAGKTVFIDSFLSFTKGQERIIREIMRTADDVYMTFMTPYAPVKKTHDKTKIDIDESGDSADKDENYFVEDEIQFCETTAELKKMLSLCSRLGKDCEVVRLDENLRHRGNPQLELIERYLFDYSCKPPEKPEIDENESENAQNVQIIRCRDKYEEAEACSAIIAKLLREGYENRDIAIVAHDITKYDGIVDSELRRHGQDCFISQSNGVLLNPVIRFVEAALSVIANGWRREDIICLLKTGVISVDSDGEDELEKFSAEIFAQYIAVWDINSRRMYTGDDWSMNPAGYKIG